MSDDEEDYGDDYVEEPPPADEDAETDAEGIAGPEVESAEETEEEENGAAGSGLEEESSGESDNEEEEGAAAEEPSEAEEVVGEAVGEAAEAAPPLEERKATPRPVAAPIRGRPARAEKQPRPDPLLRATNKPRIVRIIAPDSRRTSNVLQRGEAANILGMRAAEIAKTGVCFTEIGTLHSPEAIAFKELRERRCPLVVRRQVGVDPVDGAVLVEEWFPNTMAHPLLVAARS